MIFKISFNAPKGKVIPLNNQKQLNSFIHKSLGHNKFHDRFSEYSISGLQGGKLDKVTKTLSFQDSEPYVIIATQNDEFMRLLCMNFPMSNETFFGMTFKIQPLGEFTVNKYFDIINTISPVLVYDKLTNKKIACDNERWLDVLKRNCINKLKHLGIEDESFNIETNKTDKYKVRTVMVGDTFNICSQVTLKVTGKKSTRIALYNLGIGGSCGSGFGAVKVYYLMSN